jgi:simple sugar transport system permease protein
MLKLKSFRSFGTLISVLSAFVIGALVILVMGYSPMEAYRELYKGAFMGPFSFGTTLERFSPILLAGFGYAICIKAKYFNLGMEGCLYMGAITAGGIGLIAGLPTAIHIPLGLICGALAGAVWGGIPGILRVRYNVNEACSTIMLNYVAVLFTSFMVFNIWREVLAVARTPFIAESARFARLLRPSRVSYAIFLLIFVWVFVYWLVYKTSFGVKLRATGSNPFFSSYIGFNAKRTVMLTVCLAGAIGGFAGSIETMGIYYCVWDNFSIGIAFDGMLASLIAKNDVRKLPFSAFILAALRAGALGMERFTGIPKSLIDTLVPIMIILIAMEGIYELFASMRPKKQQSEAGE